MIKRILRALRTPPSTRDWLECLPALLTFAALGTAIASQTDLASWSPRPADALALLAVRALFIPAIGEELVFRAALVPARGESRRPIAWIAASTILFTLWHVVETAFLPGAAATFLRPDFLILAACLGLAAAILRYRAGSIWTAIVFHWLIVVAWQGYFGGPAFGSG